MKLCYLLSSAVAASMLIAGNSYAQIDSCNVFLQGNHVEIGISPSGSYGSCVPAPSGYHPHGVVSPSSYHPCSSGADAATPLGFVADPEYTGWSTDSVSHYMGDYFLPGDPFEGWSIQIGGVQYQAFNTITALPTGLTGSNISYTSVVGSVSSTWQGMVDSIEITQVTTIDSGSLYFKVQVTFTNLAVAAVDDIYYFRSVDPDNDETWPGGSFYTTNEIAHQGPDTTLVTAYGLLGPWTMLALGTTDSNSRCLIYSSWPLASTVDLSTVYNQTYTVADYTQGTTDNGDLSIGLVYRIAHLATVDSAADSTYRTTSTAHRHPANSSTITYFYAFGPSNIDSAFKGINAAHLIPTAVSNLNNGSEIKVYPNPSKDAFNVSGLNAGDQLVVFDMMGRLVQTQEVSNQAINTISINNMNPGAYILLVKDAGGNVKSRIPVQKL